MFCYLTKVTIAITRRPRSIPTTLQNWHLGISKCFVADEDFMVNITYSY